MQTILASPLVTVLAWLYGVLAFSTTVTLVHPRLRQPSAIRVRQAINSWWWPAVLGGVMVLLGAWSAMGIFAVVSAWALREYLQMLPATDRHPVIDGIVYAAVPIQYLALASGRAALFDVPLLGWVFIVLPVARTLLIGPQGTLGALPRLQLGVMLTVFALSHVVRMFMLPSNVGPVGGAGVAALFLLCVCANDAAQYAAGKLAGKHRLAPALSPNKTWEGVAGGVVVTGVLGMLVAPLVTPYGRVLGLGLGVGFSGVGLLGDLLISAVKRDAGVKDSGAVLPGQGGVLDRCDSMLLAAPLFVHGVLPWLS